uniref:Uncharacterized protein n=1 Tax=Oryza meridionalis TaxID=40149 RepID=A0A0E0CDU1_9ORYZ
MTTPHGLLQYSSGAFSDQVPADDSAEEHGVKDHAMLAPFTAAWQTAISPPLVIERSEGCYVYDVNGTKYLDALAGLLSTALGGSEPRLVKAATEQLNKLPFYHSFWNHTTRPSLDLAKELISMFTAREMGKVFFTNSGSEANDSQVKIVWYYNNALGRPKKKNIISRTQSILICQDVLFCTQTALTTGASISLIQAVVKKYDILFIVDEALSSAYAPIGAILVSPEISDVIHSHSNKLGTFAHGFTYSGHPVSCAVALEALKIYRERDIPGHVTHVAQRFQEGIKAFAAGSPIVGETRGVGLLIATEFTDNKSPYELFPFEWGVGEIFGQECKKRGMMVKVLGNLIAMSPPLIITREEIDKIQAVVKKYDILFIVDEALSSAYAPIGAILVSPEISDVIHSHSNKLGTFAHGFTYSGHPVSCAVALEALKIYRERDIPGHVTHVAQRFQEGIKAFAAGSPIVGETRGVGLLIATEFTDNKSPYELFPFEWGVGEIFGQECKKRGMMVKVLGNLIAMSPPLIITREEIDKLVSIYGEALKATEERVAELKSKKN